MSALTAGRSASKYLHIVATAWMHAASERSGALARLVFYAILLLIFSQLWAVVAERGAMPGITSVELVWYLAMTEFVVLSLPHLHLAIEQDVRSGQLACLLSRPVSYLGARIAESGGEAALRAITFAICGPLIALWLSGGAPDDPRGIALALALGSLAIVLGLLFMAAIGLLSFWLQDCSPAYWLWQKAAFVLGGLLLPLDIYPQFLVDLAWFTPFPAMIYAPASMVFAFDPGAALGYAGLLVGWIVATALLLRLLYWRALRAVDINGG